MSHSYGEDFSFIYNSDMSGDVTIVNRSTGQRMEVPGTEILDFVAHYVRLQKISKIEQMSLEELLGT